MPNPDLGLDVWREVEEIRTAVYTGDPDRSPEDDVRFLLGLVDELVARGARRTQRRR